MRGAQVLGRSTGGGQDVGGGGPWGGVSYNLGHVQGPFNRHKGRERVESSERETLKRSGEDRKTGGARTTEDSGRWPGSSGLARGGPALPPHPCEFCRKSSAHSEASLFPEPTLEGGGRMGLSQRNGGTPLPPRSSQGRYGSSEYLHGAEAQPPRLATTGAEREGACQVKR